MRILVVEDDAEAATAFYVSLRPDSRVTAVTATGVASGAVTATSVSPPPQALRPSAVRRAGRAANRQVDRVGWSRMAVLPLRPESGTGTA